VVYLAPQKGFSNVAPENSVLEIIPFPANNSKDSCILLGASVWNRSVNLWPAGRMRPTVPIHLAPFTYH